MQENNNRSWLTLPIVLIISIVIIAVILALINESDGDSDFSNTRNALNAVLDDARASFTEITTFGTSSDTIREGESLSLIDAADDPFIGDPNADIIIVEFSDFQCPFCKQAFPEIREFVTKEQESIKYIYRDFPVDDIHKDARLAAEAGACALEQDAFWQFHDKVFQNQAQMSKDFLIQYAVRSGVDKEKFETCLNEGRYTDEVEADRIAGLNAGVRGTPTWFINGEKIEGVIPVLVWNDILEILSSK